MLGRPPTSDSPGISETELTDLVHDLLPASDTTGGTQPDGLNVLLPQVYDELRRLAASYLRHERPDHTLQPTALVHEVYLRLVGDKPVDWQNRAHFIGVSARIMRRILADSAAARNTQKRGGGAVRLEFDAALELSDECTVSLAGVDDALRSLEQLDPQQAKIVELRFFGGLTLEEISEVLKISTASIRREWATARLWLQQELDFRVESQ